MRGEGMSCEGGEGAGGGATGGGGALEPGDDACPTPNAPRPPTQAPRATCSVWVETRFNTVPHFKPATFFRFLISLLSV